MATSTGQAARTGSFPNRSRWIATGTSYGVMEYGGDQTNSSYSPELCRNLFRRQ